MAIVVPAFQRDQLHAVRFTVTGRAGRVLVPGDVRCLRMEVLVMVMMVMMMQTTVRLISLCVIRSLAI